MKKLIVNADDFGLHEEINKGIIKGHREGFITSTSLMCTAPAFSQAVALAKESPALGIGIHLTLVGSVPSCRRPQSLGALVDGQGLFLPNYVAFAKAYYGGAIKKEALKDELRGQLELALGTGLKITHVDSHQHTHVLPGVASLVLDLCQEYGLKKIRRPQEPVFFTGGFQAGVGRLIGRTGLSFCSCLAATKAKAQGLLMPDHFFGMLAGGNLNPQRVAAILQALPEGTSELMTHPGLNNQLLSQSFTWQYHWQEELAAYLDKKNQQVLKEQKIELINFGDLNE